MARPNVSCRFVIALSSTGQCAEGYTRSEIEGICREEHAVTPSACYASRMTTPSGYPIQFGSSRASLGCCVTGRSPYVGDTSPAFRGKRFGTHSKMIKALSLVRCRVYDGHIDPYHTSVVSLLELLSLGFDPRDFADPMNPQPIDLS